MYADVLIMETTGNYERVFTYGIPATMKVDVGAFVLVPVRRQYCRGIVLSMRKERPDFAKVKEILQVFEGFAFLTPQAMEIARWLADYYVCSLQKVMELFLPPPVRIKERLVYLVNSSGFGEADILLLPEEERRILELLRAKGAAGLTGPEIKRRMGQAIEQELENLLEGRFLLIKKVFVTEATEKEEVIYRAKQDKPALLARAPRQQMLWRLLQERPYTATELKEKGVYHHSALKALFEKDLIEMFQREIERNPYCGLPVTRRPASLNASQITVCEELCRSVQSGHAKWLLFGVTGSGKTEVYLHVIEEVLAKGRQVLYLVPEIALTSQTVALLVEVFGKQVAVLHSALSPGERYDQWRKIKEGRAKVVIGPRSAVFAPFGELGLIIIDEEHENTYKQNEPDPRYDARIVAEKLAELSGAVLVRGSATPALRSYYAASRGEYGLLTLPERVASRPMPLIEIVDLQKEKKERKGQENGGGIFSNRMLTALQETFASDEQAILFLNRRGFHTFVMCRECGKSLVCPHCNITLNYHRAGDKLICHYCNFVRSVPRNCPFCGSTYVRYYGTGTERVAGEFARFFPQVPYLRMDTDTTQRKDSHAKMLEAFRQGKAKVLIGTQMIAKGLDFPGVTLVGVLNPDFLLQMPDYQAAERVFQLLTQVAGRAGRGEEPGKVLIQTYQPNNYLYASVLRQNYEEFYRQELANRLLMQYPPFSSLVRFLVTGYDEQQVKERIELWAEILKRNLPVSGEKPELLGPAPAPLGLLKKRYRYHIIMKGKELAILRKMASLIREKALELGGDMRTVIDLEPQSLL